MPFFLSTLRMAMGRTFLYLLIINLPGRYLDIPRDPDGDLSSESIDAEVLVPVWHGPGPVFHPVWSHWGSPAGVVMGEVSLLL